VNSTPDAKKISTEPTETSRASSAAAVQSADRLILEFAGFRQENRDMLAFDMSSLNK